MKCAVGLFFFIDQLELPPRVLDHLCNSFICDERESGFQVATED